MNAETGPDLHNAVNPHYLGHVVEAAAALETAASEDIVGGNGVKLLPKGARIDDAMRERLLQHKLHKPLEDCVEIRDGVSPAQLQPLAEQLLQEQPLLRTLCSEGRACGIPALLGQLKLSLPVQALLTVHAHRDEQRLRHAVGVTVLTLGLARRLLPGRIELQRSLALAGLVHDIGELYIDPALLRPGARLGTQDWRHIASHPLVAHRVLREMEGAGPEVAEAVLHHHERLDGFGYPRGAGGERFPLRLQLLAVSEWLMAFVERGTEAYAQASIASRLMPGEFNAELLQAIADAARECGSAPAPAAAPVPPADAAARVARIAAVLARSAEAERLFEPHLRRASPVMQAQVTAGLRRLLRIQASFSSTGLDTPQIEPLLADTQTRAEALAVVAELQWRLRELRREWTLRAGLVAADGGAAMCDTIAEVLDGA